MMDKKYKHGFVLGKFMPPHRGHQFLIDSAKKECDELTVLICSQPDDPIPGQLRLEWLRDMYPKLSIVHHPDPLPRDQSLPNFWELWRNSIRKYCPEPFDVVFSSESYGERLASELDAEHISVDESRLQVPVSATDIRTDPKRFWNFIPDNVKPYYDSSD